MRFPDLNKPEEYLHQEILLPEHRAEQILAGDYSELEQVAVHSAILDVNDSESIDNTLSEGGDDSIENAFDDNSEDEFDENDDQVKIVCDMTTQPVIIMKSEGNALVHTYFITNSRYLGRN